MFRFGSKRFGRSVHRSVNAEGSVDVSELDGVRSLHLGNTTVQSAMRVAAPHQLVLTYTRGIMCALLFREPPREVLVIGLGGGSIPKFIYHHLPQTRTRAVEINPQVIAVARSHFYLPDDDARLQVIAGDGADYLRAHPQTADLLILDAYDSHGLPGALSSQDFFDTCAQALMPDGIAAFNLWGSDRNFDVYLQRIAYSFAQRVLVLPTGRPGNVIVFGFQRVPTDLRWTTLRERARRLGEPYGIEFLDFLERLHDANPHTSNRLIL